MTALRTTRLLPLALLLAAGGCTGSDLAPYRPAMDDLPPPAADRIGYDDRTRTLRLPDPPPATRWVVLADGTPTPAGAEFRLADGLDPKETFVYYRRPGGQLSGKVSLTQILAARDTHTSLPR